MKKLRHCHPMY